jgi:hypothetical protein
MPIPERMLFDPKTPMWRIRDLVGYLGGVGKVAEKLMAKGYRPPGVNTMAGWVTRNQIPAPWLMAILSIAIEERLIINPEELLIRETM